MKGHSSVEAGLQPLRAACALLPLSGPLSRDEHCPSPAPGQAEEVMEAGDTGGAGECGLGLAGR